MKNVAVHKKKHYNVPSVLENKTGNKAVPVKQTVFTCRLLVPNHYYFKCEQ